MLAVHCIKSLWDKVFNKSSSTQNPIPVGNSPLLTPQATGDPVSSATRQGTDKTGELDVGSSEATEEGDDVSLMEHDGIENDNEDNDIEDDNEELFLLTLGNEDEELFSPPKKQPPNEEGVTALAKDLKRRERELLKELERARDQQDLPESAQHTIKDLNHSPVSRGTASSTTEENKWKPEEFKKYLKRKKARLNGVLVKVGGFTFCETELK